MASKRKGFLETLFQRLSWVAPDNAEGLVNEQEIKSPQEEPLSEERKKLVSSVAQGRISAPYMGQKNSNFFLPILKEDLRFVEPNFVRDLIPIVRAAAYWNPDISQALDNIVQLCNTPHTVIFSPDVPADQVDKMRRHIKMKSKQWVEGAGATHSMVNKMVSQLIIGGALSNEWVVQNDLKGVEKVAFVNPEDIVWAYSKSAKRWKPFQRVIDSTMVEEKPQETLIPLNTNSYQYIALNGDTELPYGIPPYLPALRPVAIQNKMYQNLDFIVDLLGSIGFLEVLLEKPDQANGESDSQYEARLESIINKAKARLTESLRDGVIAGYKEDHEFKFNATVKELSNFPKIFQENEYQVGSGIKQDLSMLGRSYANSETQITVLFSKLLAQISNIQNIIKENLEFGYKLELLLAGFKFDELHVKFDKTTAADELKYQQAIEIKTRNLSAWYNQGIIGQETFADLLGFTKPDQAEPREPLDLVGDEVKRKKREEDKDKSDKKGRDKKKERPTSED